MLKTAFAVPEDRQPTVMALRQWSTIADGASMPELGLALECSACWGAPFSGGVRCPPDFVPGKLHFKNKFCNHCRNAITVPLTHVRALNQAQAMAFINKRSEGFWNHAPANMGGGQYRIINNTAGCIGPWLALFRDAAPYTEWLAAARSNPQPLKRPP